MASERGYSRRTPQKSLPILHFYEQFVKTHQQKQASSQKPNQTMEMVQLLESSRRRHQRSVFSSRHSEVRIPDAKSSPLAMNNIVVSDAGRQTNFRKAERPRKPLAPRLPSSPIESTKPTVPRALVNSTVDKLHNIKTQHAAPTPKEHQISRTVENTKRLSMYERSKLRLQEREKKLQKVRDEMMQECTFRPKVSTQPILKSKAKHNNSTAQESVGGFSGLSVHNGNAVMRKKSPDVSNHTGTPDGITEATTPTTTSSSRQYWQNLQRNQQRRLKTTISTSVSKDESCQSRTSNTTKSCRFEELYQDGVRKARQRPATEKVERDMRQKRLEDEQLKECTFKPRLYWGKRVPTKRRKPLVSGGSVTSSRALTTSRGVQPGGSAHHHETVSAPKQNSKRLSSQGENPISNISLSPIQTGIHPVEVMDSPAVLRHSRKDKTLMPPLPREITTTSNTASESPVHQLRDWKTRLYSRNATVSPLRGPALAVEIDREPEDSPIAPRIIFCETTVAGESVGEQTQKTEYGSI